MSFWQDYNVWVTVTIPFAVVPVVCLGGISLIRFAFGWLRQASYR